MIEPLSDVEKEVLTAIVEGWGEDGYRLPGDISYDAVFRLLDRLGVPRPPGLVAFIKAVDPSSGL